MDTGTDLAAYALDVEGHKRPPVGMKSGPVRMRSRAQQEHGAPRPDCQSSPVSRQMHRAEEPLHAVGRSHPMRKGRDGCHRSGTEGPSHSATPEKDLGKARGCRPQAVFWSSALGEALPMPLGTRVGAGLQRGV